MNLATQKSRQCPKKQERWFLALGSKIVGVQHYDGVVSDRENVVLRRQPTNPYDRNLGFLRAGSWDFAFMGLCINYSKEPTKLNF